MMEKREWHKRHTRKPEGAQERRVPSYFTAAAKRESERTPLEQFVVNNEPADVSEAEAFTRELQAVLDAAAASAPQAAQERLAEDDAAKAAMAFMEKGSYLSHPDVRALIAKHQAETAALPMNPPRDVMLAHAQRQALELVQAALAVERELAAALSDRDSYREESDIALDAANAIRADRDLHFEMRVKAESALAEYRKAAPLCDKHQPSGGARGGCLVCALESHSAAFSRISYACETPNEMEYSAYDVHYDPEAVVAQVKAALAGERERCAGVLDEMSRLLTMTNSPISADAVQSAADAIRALTTASSPSSG
jgi:hypothetical protein